MIAVQCLGCAALINFASVCMAYAMSGHVPKAAYINDPITFAYVSDAYHQLFDYVLLHQILILYSD